MSLHPTILWTQTKESVLITVDITDPEDVVFDLTEDRLSFSGSCGTEKYAFDLNFFAPVVTEESKKTEGRRLYVKLKKKEAERWKCLAKEGKQHWIKCDWNRWVDSDDEDEKPNDFDMGSLDFNGFGGNQYGDDSDDGDLPDLENPMTENGVDVADDDEKDEEG